MLQGPHILNEVSSYSASNNTTSRCVLERNIVNANSRGDVERIDVKGANKADKQLYQLRRLSLSMEISTSYLKLIKSAPRNDVEYRDLRSLEGIHCPNVSYSFTKRQGQLLGKYAGYLATAAIEYPTKMSGYVRFVAVDSHSADRMAGMEIEKVCRSRPRAFFSAISHLSPSESQWMLTNVIEGNCKLKLLPEAD
jgi:hypothetical protein